MSSHHPRSWSERPSWSCTASTLAFKIERGRSCNNSETQSPKARETAESRLAEMGPVALPALEDALVNKDVEIVFRPSDCC